MLLAAGLLVAGLTGAVIAWVLAEDSADDAEESTADAVAENVRSTAESVIAGIGGAAGIVPASGPVPPESFHAFRDDVAAVSSLDVLGFVAIVPQDQRSAFETFLGRPITDLQGDQIVVAPERPVYWPVRLIAPDDPLTAPLLGLDIAASTITADPARRAVDSGEIIATESVELTPDLTVFFIIKALYRPGMPTSTVAERQAAHAGFMASAYTGDALEVAGRSAAPERVNFELRDGEVELARAGAAPSDDAVERTIEVAGRTWTVSVDDTRPVNHDLSWFLAAVTLVLVGALLYVIARSNRYERAMQRVSRLVGSTADLAQHLAGAATAGEVAEVIDRSVAPMFGAQRSRLVHLVDEAPTEQLGTVVADAVQSREVVVQTNRTSGSRPVTVAALPLESAQGDVHAVVEVEWPPRVVVDDTVRDSLRTVVELCEQTFQRAAATDQATKRADQLAQLAEGLAGASSLDEVASRITDLGRQPVGASAASIGIVDAEAGVLRVNHGDTVDDQVRSRFANPPLDARLVFTDAARTGERVLVEDYDEYCARYPDADDAVANLGTGARAALPLIDGRRTIGAVVFAWPAPMQFDDAMLSNLSTIAKMATQAILRAQLTEEQLADARHSRDLADFAQRVARVRTAEQLTDVVIEHGGTPVGSLVTNIGLVDTDRQHVATRPHPYFDEGLVERFGDRTVDDELPGIEAVRAGAPVLLANRSEIEQGYPGRFAEATREAGLSATAHLPLLGAGGAPLGGIGFAWSAPQEFSPTVVATLTTIAELCAQTLERVRLGEAEHDLVASLQERVVQPLPSGEGLSMAQRYRPAARSVGMGGDWYEGIPLVDGRYALVVGDIAGHGIHAVSDMLQLRAVVGAKLRSGVALGDLFSQATHLLDDRRMKVTATAGVMVVDPAAGTLHYVMAGHLPPVLVPPDGSPRLLEDGRQPLLGLPISPVTPGVVDFAPGSTLIAYTDGLIERRREAIDDSLQRLVDVAGATTGPVEAVADELMRDCLEGRDPGDDVALVVLRHRGDT